MLGGVRRRSKTRSSRCRIITLTKENQNGFACLAIIAAVRPLRGIQMRWAMDKPTADIVKRHDPNCRLTGVI